MANRDIRVSRENVTVEHASARGRITRNSGHFTRGSQLIAQEYRVTLAGLMVPIIAWFILFVIVLNVTLFVRMQEHEIQLILMKALSKGLLLVGFDPARSMRLTLPDGSVQSIATAYIPYQSAVETAWAKGVKCFVGSGLVAAFIAAPVTLWFVNLSRQRSQDMLEEKHERGSLLVGKETLATSVKKHNGQELRAEARTRELQFKVSQILQMNIPQRRGIGIHVPYTIAGVPYPWRTEQSHTILIGTTGSGKTTALRSLVTQMRRRGDRAIIFDLTGSFVEAFYNPETDTILNPIDTRCPAWTIFGDCANYAEFLAAAEALIPIESGSEGFWEKAARMLFVEMCIALRKDGHLTNAAIADRLMNADLKELHAALEKTAAGPLTSEKAARMAESIRATFNTNGQVLRFLPEGGNPFSICEWVKRKNDPGSILFITSHQTDMTLTRPMLTMWTNIAVNATMRLPKTRDLRTWFLFDEVHALHRLPAIEDGMQAARNFGGAFVLGIHSFAKLAETYGQEGAVHLSSLARTKLILSSPDPDTAKRCSEYIGNREVRQVDEAYSYGINSTRDAATLTPRKGVEPLVLPEDIADLPSLQGYLKFSEGFPTARVKLVFKLYEIVAEANLRAFDPESMLPPKKIAVESEEFADESDGKAPVGKAEAEAERTEPEKPDSKAKDQPERKEPMLTIVRNSPDRKVEEKGAEKEVVQPSGNERAHAVGVSRIVRLAADMFETPEVKRPSHPSRSDQRDGSSRPVNPEPPGVER